MVATSNCRLVFFLFLLIAAVYIVSTCVRFDDGINHQILEVWKKFKFLEAQKKLVRSRERESIMGEKLKRFKMMDNFPPVDNTEFGKIASLQERSYHRILQILNFFRENKNQLNLDAIWGLYIASGFLQQYHQRVNSEKSYSLLKEHNELRNMFSSDSRKEDFMDIYSVNQPRQSSLLPSPHLPQENISESLPPFLSTQCLHEPFSSSCSLTPFCFHLMSVLDRRMYSATHQVLYHAAVDRMGCPEAEYSRNFAQQMCTRILKESVNLATSRNRCQLDLWMEQMVVCALFGFREFFPQHWIKKILAISGEGKEPCIHFGDFPTCPHNVTARWIPALAAENGHVDPIKEDGSSWNANPSHTRLKRDDVQLDGGGQHSGVQQRDGGQLDGGGQHFRVKRDDGLLDGGGQHFRVKRDDGLLDGGGHHFRVKRESGNHSRVKRDDTRMAGGCSAHSTTLVQAALAQYLAFSVDNPQLYMK